MQNQSRIKGLLGKAFWPLIAVVSTVNAMLSLLYNYAFTGIILLGISIIIILRFIWMLHERRFSVDLLMGIAGIATWLIGYYFEGFLVFTLYSLSELLEEYAEEYAERKLTSLTKLLPEKITVKENRGFTEKLVEEVMPGDIVVVKPGETVPVDGILLSENALFDTSLITGEPEPQYRRRSERVESGYVNLDGLVYIRALRSPRESLLQVLVREAERALEEKSRIQRLLEKYAPQYTIVVLTLFAIALLYTPTYNALSILLAGCPSAFIIASAVATTLSIASLARRNIVVRGGRVLEDTARIRTIIFDKTGTLVLGELEVTAIHAYEGFSEEQVLELAATAAKTSNHPVSRSLSKYTSKYSPINAREYPGKGVEAIVNGVRILLGSKAFLEENNIRVPIEECREKRVYVAVNNRLAGEICLAEKISQEVIEAIKVLKEKGYRIIIASGDNWERVRETAISLGINEYYGDLSPRDKSQLVEKQKKHGKVMMVGDGINDLEALAKADVGVAIGRIDVVSNIADIVVDNVNKIPLLLEQSKKYLAAIATSIPVAAIVKIVIMIVGLLGFLPLWAIVGLGDDGTTLLTLAIIAVMISGQVKVVKS